MKLHQLWVRKLCVLREDSGISARAFFFFFFFFSAVVGGGVGWRECEGESSLHVDLRTSLPLPPIKTKIPNR